MSYMRERRDGKSEEKEQKNRDFFLLMGEITVGVILS